MRRHALQYIAMLSCLAGLLLWAGAASAQMAASAAILPVQGDRALPANIVAEIQNALTQPLAARKNYRVLDAAASRQGLGDIDGRVTDEAYLFQAGTKLGVDQVTGCYVTVKPGASDGRMTYDYTLVYVDVRGREVMATTSGSCKDCTPDMLVVALTRQIAQLYAGPYPFGLDTKPSGASVRHGDEEWGQTPLRSILPGGNYTIILEKPGYKAFEVQFPMPDDRPVYATLPLKEDPDYVPPPSAILVPGGQPEKAAPAPPTPSTPRGPQAAPSAARADRGPQSAPQPEAAKPQEPPKPSEPATRPDRGPSVQDAPQPEPEPSAPAISDDMSPRRKWAWRTVGLAVAFAAGGGGLTAAAVHSGSRASDASLLPGTQSGYADRRDAYWIGAGALYGLAAAATTTALILYFTEPESPAARVSVGPVLQPGGAGLSAAVQY
jgi:hypothetical protein